MERFKVGDIVNIKGVVVDCDYDDGLPYYVQVSESINTWVGQGVVSSPEQHPLFWRDGTLVQWKHEIDPKGYYYARKDAGKRHLVWDGSIYDQEFWNDVFWIPASDIKISLPEPFINPCPRCGDKMKFYPGDFGKIMMCCHGGDHQCVFSHGTYNTNEEAISVHNMIYQKLKGVK